LAFGFYGLVKKTGALGSVHGLILETGILLLPSILYLLYLDMTGTGAFLRVDATTDLLLVGTGLVTIVPLLLFASAAQRVSLTELGMMQYISPTLQFLLGILVYDEPFTLHRLIGFGFVWIALAIFV